MQLTPILFKMVNGIQNAYCYQAHEAAIYVLLAIVNSVVFPRKKNVSISQKGNEKTSIPLQ